MGDQHLKGVGVTARQLEPGTAVMVPVGRLNAQVNGGPCVIAWAVVRGPAGDGETSARPSSMYWLDVYVVPGGEPIPQMYAAAEILGVPAVGLRMDGVQD